MPILQCLVPIFVGLGAGLLVLLTAKHWIGGLGRLVRRIEDGLQTATDRFASELTPPDDSKGDEL